MRAATDRRKASHRVQGLRCITALHATAVHARIDFQMNRRAAAKPARELIQLLQVRIAEGYAFQATPKYVLGRHAPNDRNPDSDTVIAQHQSLEVAIDNQEEWPLLIQHASHLFQPMAVGIALEHGCNG